MANKPVPLRLPEEMIDELKRLDHSDNISGLIREFLAEKIDEKKRGLRAPKPILMTKEELEAEERKELVMPPASVVGRRAHYKYDKFKLPVGDCTWSKQGDMMKIWWCASNKIDLVTSLAKPWTENGFSFHVGTEENSDYEEYNFNTQVIMCERQQRGRNLRFQPSCDLIPALIGDKMVWFDIVDIDKAYNYLLKHADMPCILRQDLIEYSDNPKYKKVFDLFLSHFAYYYNNNRPKALDASYEDFIKSEL